MFILGHCVTGFGVHYVISEVLFVETFVWVSENSPSKL